MRRLVPLALALLAAASLAPGRADAVTLDLRAEIAPYPGVTLRTYRTSSPATDTWVALVDLCHERVHVDATGPPSSLRTAGAWGGDAGVQLAANGDFYRTGPVRVYGDAVGGGVPWPLDQTGLDPQYDDEWYHNRYGWIAFGHDRVEFSHTRWVKRNWPGLSEGWHPTEVVTTRPPGMTALVSGFPELVIEGDQVTCSSPTASSCFPDRSDMRERHPRTAMGLTADRQTFILAVVDGRSGTSAGMYGAELADLMAQLGAWVAFNLDGGGSSQLWIDGRGYVNAASTNNGGGGVRSVANHWGVFAGSAGGMPERPGHCVSSPPCGVIGPGGGIVDDTSPCFHAFGPDQYWRHESEGYGGSLHWTNAFRSDVPWNWAWWQVELEQAGRYRVELYGHPDWAVFDAVPYEVRAAGVVHEVTVDQSAADGWHTIGTFDFAAGGGQDVRVFDNLPYSVPSDQHVVADAIRLTRIGGWCGDGACDADEGCGACPTDCPCACGEVCQGGACVFAACDGRACGPDGCGGSCGACPEHHVCEDGACVPVPWCGDGACDAGEGCGGCPADCPCACGEVCRDGACVFAACDGRACGPDGCGGSCGACPEHHACEDGVCVESAWCGDGACAEDEGCAVCPADCPCACGEVCRDGACVFAACDGRACGPDGCGGACGACPEHHACEDGVCVATVTCGDGVCDADEGCAVCPADCPCACGEVCRDGACVFAACDGRACGPDGCGGSCGGCPARHTCDEGVCVREVGCGDGVCGEDEGCGACPADCPCACGEVCKGGACVFAACDGRACGPDGCGGSCGGCAEGYTCVVSACLPRGADAGGPAPLDAADSGDDAAGGGDDAAAGGGADAAPATAPDTSGAGSDSEGSSGSCTAAGPPGAPLGGTIALAALLLALLLLRRWTASSGGRVIGRG